MRHYISKVVSGLALVILTPLCLSSCADLLDRPPKTTVNDNADTWTDENLVRNYVNELIPKFIIGYNDASMHTGDFSDDAVFEGRQSNFRRSVPTSSIWSMSTLRDINLMSDRLETYAKGQMPAETYNHWMGVARFFRAYKYALLTRQWGDVPYSDKAVGDDEQKELYKPRTPRNEVMDNVYDDLKFALANVRLNDGDQQVNRYWVAGIAAQLALSEASWQKYYYRDNERAKKFYDLALETTDMIISSGKYRIDGDYKSLYTSESLAGNKECIIYRVYDLAAKVGHDKAHYSNTSNSIAMGGTTDLLKSYICIDGNVREESSVEGAKSYRLEDLVKTTDSRFEATFYDKPTPMSKGSYLFPNKFFPRRLEGLSTLPPEYQGSGNTTDAPVLRYAEILLINIETKAELASMGGPAVTQSDLDLTINAIRKRPLAPEAVAKGVKETAPLMLASLPDDPNRDPDVSRLMWEIRRERRMEFAFDGVRFDDLKRWGKLEYMDTSKNPDLLSGAWVDFALDKVPLDAKSVGVAGVITADGSKTIYNGKNAASMKGFYISSSTEGRLPFLGLVNVNPYLSPVGKNQMDDYQSKGYTLKQTEGWPQE